MDLFYTIVLIVAVILLILMLAFIGLRMANNTNLDITYPPNSMNCPDKWKGVKIDDSTYHCLLPEYSTDASGNVDISGNIGTLYSGSTTLNTTVIGAPGYTVSDASFGNRFNFNSTGWAGYEAGLSADCSKRSWSLAHGLLWDGITNYNKCD